MRGLYLGVALALVGGTAMAQTTTCRNTAYGMPQLGVTCDTEQPKPKMATSCAGSILNAFDGCSIAEVKAANKRVAAEKVIGPLIADGKCDEALSTALRTGDLDLAREVRDFCAASKR